MSDSFDVIPVPVITVDVTNPIPVIEVTIDKTGPQGPPGLDGTTADHNLITNHISDGSDPHGSTLVQTSLEALKAMVGVVDGGEISTDQTVDFSVGGCYTYEASDTPTLTVSSLDVGQRGSVHIFANGDPVITWVGVDAWIGGEPVYAPGKLTVVTLFNDGTRIIGSFGQEA